MPLSHFKSSAALKPLTIDHCLFKCIGMDYYFIPYNIITYSYWAYELRWHIIMSYRVTYGLYIKSSECDKRSYHIDLAISHQIAYHTHRFHIMSQAHWFIIGLFVSIARTSQFCSISTPAFFSPCHFLWGRLWCVPSEWARWWFEPWIAESYLQ